MIWLETQTQEDANQRQSAMWGTVWSQDKEGNLTGKAGGEGLDEGGRFWADAIKDTYDLPEQRLEMARRHLPLPAAFREASIALRAIIRAKRKCAEPIQNELVELHQLAAVQSLAPYHQLDITPYANIARLDLSVDCIGWDKLVGLNATDRKWMADAWPQPTQHTTGASLYPHISQGGQLLVEKQREMEMKRSLAMIDQMFEREGARPNHERNRKGWIYKLFDLFG